MHEAAAGPALVEPPESMEATDILFQNVNEQTSSKNLVQRHAQRPGVRGEAQRLPREDLGCAVPRVATARGLRHHARAGRAVEIREDGAGHVLGARGPAVQQHILRLHVVVRLAEVPVQVPGAPQQLREEPGRPALRRRRWEARRRRGQELREVPSRAPFHDNEGGTRLLEAPQGSHNVGVPLAAEVVVVAGVCRVVRALRDDGQLAAPFHRQVRHALRTGRQPTAQLVLRGELTGHTGRQSLHLL
mmetsp:Transcript_85862/g.277229  ORF Transcript_85862/g.277229 Transcript_85862/m.277229 type:complete len:246 (+) Transcript_85862:563-1300(+)